MESTRPRQYWDDYASRFKNRSLAELYKFRPPYPDETYEILLNLLGESRRKVLDVGCGPGKIARALVNHVDGVDAVDFSMEMIQVGKSLVNGNHPNLRWINGPVEKVQLYPPYDMVTAGASIHWMEWCVVFPRFKEVLTTDGYLVIIDGDCPVESPWHDAELSLIHKYSTNRHHERIDLIQELVNRGHLQLIGDRRTTPVSFSQPLTDYVQSFHSRESMSKEHMGAENVKAFDTELSHVLSDFVDDEGFLTFQLEARVTWGRPLT
ncbi:class I SAM-dependent methyltransferase [Candidatus Poribacteria bacterium]|nr:class I SAM-dependent methyltransferase [Candidatus Poribacteria bacterium]MYH80189.1 class I SAM-dependent methyltransferase [Candidatus Poribacteria bacterium]MYK96362.1 class I SAM-dependent methyltransferase [Candidatus Poribacteria bacterium]